MRTFEEDTGNAGYIFNRLMKDFDLTLYPEESGTASLVVQRVLPDGTAQLHTYENFPITTGEPLQYSPNPDSYDIPAIVLGDGTLYYPDKTSAVFTVSDMWPGDGQIIEPGFPLITAKLSKDIDPDTLKPGSLKIIITGTDDVLLSSYTYDEGQRLFTVTPHVQLPEKTQFTVNVSLMEVELVDQEVDSYEFSWDFFTGE